MRNQHGKIMYCLFQISFNAIFVGLWYVHFFRGVETSPLILIAVCVYIPILFAIHMHMFPKRNGIYQKVIVYFVFSMIAAFLMYTTGQAVYQRLLSEEGLLYGFKVKLLLASSFLSLYQLFSVVLFIFLFAEDRRKTLCRFRRIEYIYWIVLLCSVYFTAYHSYQLNAESVYQADPDFGSANRNIIAASILVPAGLSLLIIVMFSQMEPKTINERRRIKKTALYLELLNRFAEFRAPVFVGYVGDPIAAVVLCAFVSVLGYLAAFWSAGWVKGGYGVWAVFTPVSVFFFYLAKKYNRMRNDLRRESTQK